MNRYTQTDLCFRSMQGQDASMCANSPGSGYFRNRNLSLGPTCPGPLAKRGTRAQTCAFGIVPAGRNRPSADRLHRDLWNAANVGQCSWRGDRPCATLPRDPRVAAKMAHIAEAGVRKRKTLNSQYINQIGIGRERQPRSLSLPTATERRRSSSSRRRISRIPHPTPGPKKWSRR